ncbi:MAG: ribosome assembly factor SBDS [Candidatus Diapherotrites archaeon]|nr:ribosome assembly factor SBDS [Candidatus Diapherotrites archaeon]
MVSIEDAVTARLKIEGHIFEILVDPDLALQFKQKQKVDFNTLLAGDYVYKDAGKGDVASEILLQKYFKTNDTTEIAKVILEKGELNLTTEQRRKMMEQTRKQIIAMISRRAVDPQNKTPHPPQRIELAMEQAKVRVDPMKPVETQVTEIVEKLRPLIPISLENVNLEVKVASNYAAKVYHVVQRYNLVREDWLGDGSLVCVVKLPAGGQDEFIADVNRVAHGNVMSRILK